MDLNFTITAWDMAGLVSVDINGVEYDYFVDALMIPDILALYERNPGKALNLLKTNGKLITKEVLK